MAKKQPTQALVIPDLTLKQRKWLKGYLETGNASKAAWEAYDCKDMVSAGNIGAENLQKLQNPMRLLLEANGLSQGSLVKIAGDAIKATKIHSSHTEPDREVPDHKIRLEAADRLAKWLGVESQPVQQPQIQAQNVQINFKGWRDNEST